MNNDSVLDPRYDQPTVRVPDDIMDDAAKHLAKKLWEKTELARRWLEDRKRGKGDPAAGDAHISSVGSLIVDCARTIEEMEKDDFDHLESYQLLQGTLERLRELDDELYQY